jgi:hypothetical protein
MMPMTPLQEIEARLHDYYGTTPPTQEEAGNFVVKQFPKMDGGLSIAIALAALALQGWQVYRTERDRSIEAKTSGDGNGCPRCGNPELSKDPSGKSVCKNNHTW